MRLSAWRFGVLVALGYALALIPWLVRAHFDSSVFIIAGDHFVDAAALAVPIHIMPHGAGFDGQFYYRMALSPFTLSAQAFGITLDAPALRMQRILYPLLVWVVTLGHKSLVAPAMVGVNLLGLGLAAGFALRLVRRLGMSGWWALAVMLWPGFIISLSRDTTEIWSACFVIAFADGMLAGKIIGIVLAGAAACLTRETALPVMAGVFCYAALRVLRAPGERRRWLVAAAVGATVLPWFGWQLVLRHAFGSTAGGSDAAANLGLPLQGMLAEIRFALGPDPIPEHHRFLPGSPYHTYILCSIAWLSVWLIAAAACVPGALRRAGGAVLVAAWLPLAVLMMTMTGPWIAPESYLRAFTECYVFGTLIVGLASRPRWATVLFWASLLLFLVGDALTARI